MVGRVSPEELARAMQQAGLDYLKMRTGMEAEIFPRSNAVEIAYDADHQYATFELHLDREQFKVEVSS